MDSVVELYLNIVDRTLQQDHLLALTHVVYLLIFRHFIIIGSFKLVLSECLSCELDLFDFLFVLASVQMLLLSKGVDFGFALLTVKFALGAFLVSFGFENLFCLLLTLVKRSSLSFLSFVGIGTVF
jgi:hypothetical protein